MLTKNQREVLAYVVVDPDAWYTHAVATFGQSVADQHLAAKVKRHEDSYLSAKKELDYKTRAERETDAV